MYFTVQVGPGAARVEERKSARMGSLVRNLILIAVVETLLFLREDGLGDACYGVDYDVFFIRGGEKLGKKTYEQKRS